MDHHCLIKHRITAVLRYILALAGRHLPTELEEMIVGFIWQAKGDPIEQGIGGRK